MNDEDRTFPADAVALITAMVVAILGDRTDRERSEQIVTPATAAEPTPTKIEAPRVIP